MALKCWWCDENGEACEKELYVQDDRYHCPEGHYLRQWDDLSHWTREHIELMQGEPAMHTRFYDYRGDDPE